MSKAEGAWILRSVRNAKSVGSKTNVIREEDSYALVFEPTVPPPTSNQTTTKREELVTVRFTHSSLNHRDNWMTMGAYPGIREGVCLGSDGCATVVSSPSDASLVGKRVLLDPSFGWGRDESAPQGVLEILGMPRHGTFSRLNMTFPKENVHVVPDHLSSSQAAALPLAGVTAWRALMYKGKAKPGSKVLITGIGGGVALFALQFAAALGCDTYVTSSSQQKIDMAVKKFGAKGGVLYTDPNWSKALIKVANGARMDIVVDGAGGEGINQCVRAVRGGGRIVIYGSTAGPTLSVTAPSVFLNQLEILGTAMGSPQDFNEMIAFVAERRLVPHVDAEFPFEELPSALQKMRKGEQFGKIVLSHL